MSKELDDLNDFCADLLRLYVDGQAYVAAAMSLFEDSDPPFSQKELDRRLKFFRDDYTRLYSAVLSTTVDTAHASTMRRIVGEFEAKRTRKFSA